MDFDTKEKLAAAHIWHPDEHLAALAARKPGVDFTAPMASFCKTKKDGSDDCFWDNRYTPSHRLTKAPMAALVGPGCASTCDAIALDFEREHFGPLVGEPPASGTTSLRIDRPIVLPGGRKFGTLKIAFTREYDGKTGELMEGVPTRVSVPLDRTFDNRATYDRDLVDAAIRALGTPAKH
jgi:C-terminal processing protease CtpA/Prc